MEIFQRFFSLPLYNKTVGGFHKKGPARPKSITVGLITSRSKLLLLMATAPPASSSQDFSPGPCYRSQEPLGPYTSMAVLEFVDPETCIGQCLSVCKSQNQNSKQTSWLESIPPSLQSEQWVWMYVRIVGRGVDGLHSSPSSPLIVSPIVLL